MTTTELPAVKKIVSLLVIALCSSVLIPIVTAQSARADSTVFTTSDRIDGTVMITGCTAKCSGDLVIPGTIDGKTVTSIGQEAFYGKGLTSVSIPSSVTSIGNYAFGDNQLSSVSIPSSVTMIGYGTFYANKLTSVSIPSAVTSIGSYAFYYNQLTSVSIPSAVTRIDKYAFAYNQLTSVTFLGDGPSGGGNVFVDNSSLSSVVVPSNAIGFGVAFSGVTVSYTGDPIEARPVFTTSDNGDGTVTITGCSANCSDDLVIPGAVTGKTVTLIGANAFQGKGLTSVSIANSVTSIGRRAFMQNSLQSVTLSRSVTSIGDSAFYNNQITSVTIPSSVTSIGAYAFYNNLSTSVTFLGDAPPDDGTIFVNHSGLPLIVVPSDAIGFGDTFSTIPVARSGAAFHHTVTYSVAGGSAVTSDAFTTGGSISTAPVSTRAGYTLSGWSETESGSVVTFPYSPTATSDITLHAIWSGNVNTVSYSAAGGSSVASGSFTTGGSISTAPVSTRAGYTLSGWSETESGSVVTFPYSPAATSDITLYAIWALTPVKPTYVTGAIVKGKSKVGKSVSVVTGRWNGTVPITFTYQWYSCKSAGKKVLTTGKAAAKCTAIKKATKATFKVTAKVKGTFLAVLITGTNGTGKSTIFTKTVGKVS